MADTREKLIELVNDVLDYLPWGEIASDTANNVADHLIANGVTVQEWIPVTERLPTIHDADNCVLAIHKVTNKRYYHWRTVADNPFDFTHWSRVPEPPKGE